MKLEITKDVEDLFIANRDIKVGDKFDVVGKPDVFINSKGVKKTGYLIYSKNDKALVVYNDEAKVLD